MRPTRIAAALLAKKPVLITGVFLIVVGLLSPASGVAQQRYPSSVSEYVAGTKAQIKTIDMVTFKSALDRNDLGLIVDVREPAEYADGHIPGAINIPRGQIEFRIGRMSDFQTTPTWARR